jgi:hypothetical protein
MHFTWHQGQQFTVNEREITCLSAPKMTFSAAQSFQTLAGMTLCQEKFN